MSNQNQQISKVQQAATSLDALQMPQVAERAKNNFVSIYKSMHGADGERFFEAEKFHFLKQINENNSLKECTKLSLYGAFMDVAVQGLSFDPSKKLCYLIPYSHNAGTKDRARWEKRASLQISPYGELYLRQLYGQIHSADNPVIVYEGDEFRVTTTASGKAVYHQAAYPRTSNKIVACFIRIVKADHTIDFSITDIHDMMRLKEFSKKKNKGNANALYGDEDTQVDAGFLVAKTIKHAFKAYPKVKLRGQFSKLETETIEEAEISPIDYGIDMETGEITDPQQQIAAPTSPSASTPTPAAAPETEKGKEAAIHAAASVNGKATVTHDDETF